MPEIIKPNIRWIVIFNTGFVQHSEQLSKDYLHLHDIGVIRHIIDAHNGTAYSDNDWKKIPQYN